MVLIFVSNFSGMSLRALWLTDINKEFSGIIIKHWLPSA